MIIKEIFLLFQLVFGSSWVEPNVKINIPKEILESEKTFDRVELAKRIAAARKAEKESNQAIGSQLSWEGLVAPMPGRHPVQDMFNADTDELDMENQDQLVDQLPDIKRFVHIDLAAGRPSVEYLKEVFALLKNIGASGIFLEWEQTFPYGGDISFLSNPDRSYSRSELDEIIKSANENKLEIIPLVDVCTNAEFATKHKPELKISPSCFMDFHPLNDSTKKFVKTLLSEILQAHPLSSWIHIGCGLFKSISRNILAKEIHERNTTTTAVYLDYIEDVGKTIQMLAPNVRALVWDDTLRNMNNEVLIAHKAPDYFDVVIKNERFGGYLDARATLKLLNFHGKIFEGIWIATSFKCGQDVLDPLPDIKRNSLQAEELFQAAKNAPEYANIIGFVITGKSRYTHFAAMCSLLPISLPSLVTSYKTTIRGAFTTSVLWESSRTLGFQGQIPTINRPRPQAVIPGNFPGSEIWRSTQLLENVKGKIHSFLEGPNYNSFFNKHLVKTGRVSYYRLETIVKELKSLTTEVKNIKDTLVVELLKIYNDHVVNEWIVEQVQKEEKQLDEKTSATSSYLERMKKEL